MKEFCEAVFYIAAATVICLFLVKCTEITELKDQQAFELDKVKAQQGK